MLIALLECFCIAAHTPSLLKKIEPTAVRKLGQLGISTVQSVGDMSDDTTRRLFFALANEYPHLPNGVCGIQISSSGLESSPGIPPQSAGLVH